MTSTYNYSLTSDFNRDLKTSQLHKEIENDTGITPNLIGIRLGNDNVGIEFDSALSAGEQTTLNGLVSAHTSDNSAPRTNFYDCYPKRDNITSTTYEKMGSFKYGGSDQIGIINYIDVISHKDSSLTSYDIRIYDQTNNLVITERTGLTNTEEVVNDLGTISNIPTAEAVLEIQAKRTGGSGKNKNVYIDQAIIYYNN